MSFKLYETLCDENFAFGSVNINYVEVEIYDLQNNISGCVIEPIVITDAKEEIPLGKFKAEKPKTEDNMTSFTAYSLLKYNTSDVYVSSLPTDQQGCAPLKDVWAEVCTQCKVEYEDLTVPDIVKGVGYRCGGNSYSTHMDINYRIKKWFGDEKKSMSASIGKSFYPYVGVKYSAEKTTANVNVRKEPSLSGEKYKTLPKGTTVSVADTEKISNDGLEWVRIKIGSKHYWIAEKYLK